MKPNFIFIHSTGGYPEECWYPWLQTELKNLGCKVTIPTFPTPDNQSLDFWMQVFGPYFEEINENTVLIGRSIGPPFILRVLEKLNKPIKAAFLVAGFCSNLGLPDFAPLIDSFTEEPFNWEKIKANCKEFHVYHADNDPIVPLAKGQELANNLDSEIIIIPGAGHFTMSSEYGERFPELLEKIKEMFRDI
jgi:uncharacterized protein